MNKCFPILALMFLAACGTSPSLNDSDFDKVGNTLEKAWEDTKDEGVRFNEYVDGKGRAAADKARVANEDFNDEEHRFTGRTKDTLAKANMDTLDTLAKANSDFNDEEHRLSGNTKDTLAKANMDAVNEEHRFNDNFKDTTKKANMDTIAEGDKLTDRIVGSDDKTIDQQGDDIRDLQKRQKLDETRISALEKASALYSQLIAILFKTTEDEETARKAADESEAASREAADAQLAASIATSAGQLTQVIEALRSSLEGETQALRDRLTDTEDEIVLIQGRLDTIESEYQTACDVQSMINDAIAAQNNPSCTVTPSGTTTSVPFTDYTDRDGDGAYCRKNSFPWNTNTNNIIHGNQCPTGWTYFPSTYSGDEGITNTIQVPNYSVSCTLNPTN